MSQKVWRKMATQSKRLRSMKSISCKIQELKSRLQQGDEIGARAIYFLLQKEHLSSSASYLIDRIINKYATSDFTLQDTKLKLSELEKRPTRPGISIVSCCMNRNTNLRKGLMTWLTLPVDEIIIVDWNSQEPVSETIADVDDKRVRIIRIEDEPRWILTYAFNVGLRYATCEKIFKLDADIQVTPDFIARNSFAPGEYIRGNWQHAVQRDRLDQVYLNGSFGCLRDDLRAIGYYNEFIRSYGWDDSDLYYRLWFTLGLNHRYFDPEVVEHAHQDVSDRLKYQDVARHDFLDTFPSTEFLNYSNRYISLNFRGWQGDFLQDYEISIVSDSLLEGIRVTDDIPIPEYILNEAHFFGALALLSWKNIEWANSIASHRPLGYLLLSDYREKIPFCETSDLIGFSEVAYPVIFSVGRKAHDIMAIFYRLLTDHRNSCSHNEQLMIINPYCDESHSAGFISRMQWGIYNIIWRHVSHQTYAALIRVHKPKITNINEALFEINEGNYKIEITGDLNLEIYNGEKLLITSLYDELNDHRMDEYVFCLKKNAELFDVIIVLYEESNGDLRRRITESFAAVEDGWGQKGHNILIMPIKSRPKFADMFNVVDEYFPGFLACVSNADICFDDTINTLYHSFVPDAFVVLSRHENDIGLSIADLGLIRHDFALPNTFSSDAWIYIAPLRHEFRSAYEIGTFYCDSFLNYHISKSGYKLYNPCLSIGVYHIHDPSFNSSQDKFIKQREAIDLIRDNEAKLVGESPVRGVQWCRLKDISNPELGNMVHGWDDLIFVVRYSSDTRDITAGILLTLMLMRIVWGINGKVWGLIPLSAAEGMIGDLIYELKAYLNNEKLLIGIHDHFCEGPLTGNKPGHRHVNLIPSTLIECYRAIINHEFGSMFDHSINLDSNYSIWRMDDVSFFTATARTEAFANDIDISALCAEMHTQDIEYFQQYLARLQTKTELDLISGTTPFLADLSYSFTGINNRGWNKHNAPDVTFVTSIFKGAEFFEKFLHNIAVCCVEANGEIILVDAGSPQEEKSIFDRFITEHPEYYDRFKYISLDKDPGLYNCWRIGIENARAPYVTNANLDDRRSPHHTKALIELLNANPDIAGAATAIRATRIRNSSWFDWTENEYWFIEDEVREINFFDLYKHNEAGLVISQNIMHCMPVWRKNIHNKYGFFDEEQYGTSADWAFWLKCAKAGERFLLLPKPLGLYYINPRSHNRINDTAGIKERRIIEDMIGFSQEIIKNQ